MREGDAAQKSGDYATALREWTFLVKRENRLAQVLLGQMYNPGKCVFQNYNIAVKWHTLSGFNVNENGGKIRGLATKITTPTDISKARDLARECVRKKYKGC